MGGLGLRSAERTRWPALGQLGGYAANDQGEAPRSGRISSCTTWEGGASSPCLGSACRPPQPSMGSVTAGQRPPIIEVEDREPGVPRQGRQHAAAIRIESSFRTEILMPRMSPVEQALLRSQSGPCAGVAFSVCPSSPLTRIDSALFRVLLQRRLHLPLPLSQRICGSGRPLDPFGQSPRQHVRGLGLWEGGASLWRVRPPQSAGKLGGRVVTNMFVREIGLGAKLGQRLG